MAFQTINFRDLDFLEDDADDLILSQICEEIEKEQEFFDNFQGITLSQTVRDYECEFEIDVSDDEILGNFDIKLPEIEQIEESSRFGDAVSDEEIRVLIESQENANTKKNTRWAVNIFEKWRLERNKQGSNILPLEQLTTADLNTNLIQFIMRVKRQDGHDYPPKSLYLISCGLLRYLRDKGVHDKNFFDSSNANLAEFRKVLDSKMKELLTQGIGTKRKQADPIMPEDEATIWDKGVFGMKNGDTLQCTIFYYCCKIFGLRGHDEHHNLDCSQFHIGEDTKGKFVEFFGKSKTFKGGLGQRELHNKHIKHYCESGPRCLADYFQTYLNALGNNGRFYRRPLTGNPIRYGNQVVGVNKLKCLMKIICFLAGLQGNYTNHSGKRTCATALYQARIDEMEIMQRTGHRSEKGVRAYKRTNSDITKNVSSVLNPPMPMVYHGFRKFGAYG